MNKTTWDACVIGNGMSSRLLCQYLLSQNKSVLWITSDKDANPKRALLQHAWFWSADAQSATWFTQKFNLNETQNFENSKFEEAYYDAKHTRRLKKMNEVNPEFGPHEKDYFESIMKDSESNYVNLWKVADHIFNTNTFVENENFQIIELPIHELKISGDIETAKISSVIIADDREFFASEFILGDYDQNFSQLIKDEKASEAIALASKGKVYHAGFGLHFKHKNFDQAIEQVMIVPMTVNPTDSKSISHLAGKFYQDQNGELFSMWIGFLNDQELEDNNEILKKMKHSKRAIERAIPGFSESIVNESITFEPHMRATMKRKNKHKKVLGATFISDTLGPQDVIGAMQSI